MNNSKKKPFLFLASAALIVGIIHMTPYILAQQIVTMFNLSTHNLTTALDNRIPFVPPFIIVYLGCFLFWIVEFLNSAKNKEVYSKFLIASLFGGVVCFICFVFFPVEMSRPEIIGTDVFSFLIRLAYGIDRPINLLPSMHCFASWLCFIMTRSQKSSSKMHIIFSFVICVLICLSTLFVKQHIVLDVFAGILLAEISYLFTKIRNVNEPAKKIYAFLERKFHLDNA